MSELFQTNAANWLGAEKLEEPGVYKTRFKNHHLGNVFIRSLHGGVTGAMIEIAAEAMTREKLGENAELMISAVSIDYLRITKDADLYARATIQRLSRRLSIVDVTCWQDSEDVTVGRGVVTIKIG